MPCQPGPCRRTCSQSKAMPHGHACRALVVGSRPAACTYATLPHPPPIGAQQPGKSKSVQIRRPVGRRCRLLHAQNRECRCLLGAPEFMGVGSAEASQYCNFCAPPSDYLSRCLLHWLAGRAAGGRHQAFSRGARTAQPGCTPGVAEKSEAARRQAPAESVMTSGAAADATCAGDSTACGVARRGRAPRVPTAIGGRPPTSARVT